jgi:hypothetical protein
MDAALARRNTSPADRRTQVLSMRARIMEQLALRAPNRAPTGADIAAVLSALGPPDSTPPTSATAPAATAPATPAPSAAPGPRPDAMLSRLAIAGLLWSPLFFLLVGLLLVRVNVTVKPGETEPAWITLLNMIVWPLGAAAPLATTVMGLLALGDIQKSNGMKYGLSLALFDALLFPLLLANVAIFWICLRIASSIPPGFLHGLIGQMLPTIGCILLDYYVAIRAWRAVQPGAQPPQRRRR